MKIKSFSKKFIFLFIALLSGCAALPNAITEKINNQQIELALIIKPNTAPVIFENGLSGRMEWWKEVIPEISKEATTFAYNRPGYGNSDPVSTPRDGLHIVEELRKLLRSKDLKPPYILVGHSMGGLYMQLFARRYPDEVSALILVDSTHPKQLEGEGSLDRQSFFVKGLIGMLVTGTAKEELDLLPQTGTQLLSLPTLVGKPVFVLSASEPLEEKSKLADDANEKRKDIARLYPGSKQIWVKSGHGIPLEKPEAVISAIRETLLLKTSNKTQVQ